MQAVDARSSEASPCAQGWMSVPSRAMLLRDPKVMLPKALSRRQSLQGAPMSKKRRLEGLMRMYLQPRHASKTTELSSDTEVSMLPC